MKLSKRKLNKFQSSHDVFSTIGGLNRLAAKRDELMEKEPGSPLIRALKQQHVKAELNNLAPSRQLSLDPAKQKRAPVRFSSQGNLNDLMKSRGLKRQQTTTVPDAASPQRRGIQRGSSNNSIAVNVG